MDTLIWILLATFFVSVISLAGIFTLSIKEKILNKILLFMVSLSAGALMGGAFIHLLPEAMEKIGNTEALMYGLAGFLIFFIIEKVLHWRHCHEGHCHVHTFAYMNLVGDSVHNFIDGLIIAASFVVDVRLGIVTTAAVALHEIPQEIGDFGVLVYGGFKRSRALMMNFVTALTAVLGGILGYVLSSQMQTAINFIIPFAAGGFIYIGASDLIPEIRKETRLDKSMISLAVFIIGILIMYGMKFIVDV
jgi:zinc and cadmium transporter